MRLGILHLFKFLNIQPHNLVVVEVVLGVADDLVVFVAFAGNEDDIVFAGKGASRLDGGLAVNNHQGGQSLLRCQAFEHIIQDGLRVFVTRIVRRQNHLRRACFGYLRHHRTFAFVTIAAAADDGD